MLKRNIITICYENSNTTCNVYSVCYDINNSTYVETKMMLYDNIYEECLCILSSTKEKVSLYNIDVYLQLPEKYNLNIYPIDIKDEYDELMRCDFDELFIQFDFVEFY